jgi:hypothetical protein
VLFAQLWGVGGVRILTFTVIPTPFIRTSRRVGAGLGAHFERFIEHAGDGWLNIAQLTRRRAVKPEFFADILWRPGEHRLALHQCFTPS